MTKSYRSLLLFGAPGVGKGTQGKIVGQIPGFCHLATGDMFRSLEPESPLGREFHTYSSRGELVPDELTVELWQQYVRQLIEKDSYHPDRDTLVLDGIPRSIDQARMLDDYIDVLAVIHLTAPDIEEMVQRMKRRAIKENRHDDADEQVIRRRFTVYQSETAPVLAHYPDDVVHQINALGTPVEVLLRVLQVVAPLYAGTFGNPLGATR